MQGRVYLNNAPYYLKLVLDQGYWPDSLLTPPTDEAIQYDIKMTKAFGFNGARKHQKVEDPRWLYWCDKLGLLVWGEMANAHAYSEEYVARFVQEWQQIIARDYNHPSIMTWVPINESWGVSRDSDERRSAGTRKSMYHLTRSLDQTRLVIDNDGWEHTDATDLFTLHDYARTGEEMAAKYKIARKRSHPRPAQSQGGGGFRLQVQWHADADDRIRRHRVSRRRTPRRRTNGATRESSRQRRQCWSGSMDWSRR